MEYLDQFGKTWHLTDEGVNRVRHCMVALSSRGQMIAIGGQFSSNSVEMYDSYSERWFSLPNITAHRYVINILPILVHKSKTTNWCFSDKHSCILLPKKVESNKDRILILSSLSNAFIYEVQTGKTIMTDRTSTKRGFSCLSKLNNGIYVIGGDFETDIVEMFNEENGKFETLSQKIMVGRSRAACVSVSKAFIRELGFNCF